MWHK